MTLRRARAHREWSTLGEGDTDQAARVAAINDLTDALDEAPSEE